MKKLLFACVAGMLAASVYGQGLVTINDTIVNISTNNGVASGVMGRTANSFYFTLLTLPDPTGSTTVPTITSASQLVTGGWSASGVMGTNGTSLPLGGKILAVAGNPGVAVSGWNAGDTNFVVVVGWSASNGANWAAISSSVQNGTWSGFFGYSLVGYGAATGLAPGFSVFGSNPGQVNSGFTMVTAVPEPGTIALACLGGASLLLFRRRK